MQIRKDIIHKLLKDCRGISKAKRHDYLFKGFIAGV